MTHSRTTSPNRRRMAARRALCANSDRTRPTGAKVGTGGVRTPGEPSSARRRGSKRVADTSGERAARHERPLEPLDLRAERAVLAERRDELPHRAVGDAGAGPEPDRGRPVARAAGPAQ